MSFNGINEYTKDFTCFSKCYFEKGDLSIKGYELELIKYYQSYIEQGKNYLTCLLEASPYLPVICITNIFSLLPCIIDIPKYEKDVIDILANNTEVLKTLVTKNFGLADEILQIADHLNCIEAGLGAKVMSGLIPTLDSLPTWIKDYGTVVLVK